MARPGARSAGGIPAGWQSEGQYGQEPTPEEYVDHLRATFTEARRVLAEDG